MTGPAPRPRVLFLATEFPTAASPVVGTFVREHARAAALHADVVVLHLERAPGRGGLFEIEEERAGGLAGGAPGGSPGDVRVVHVRYRRFGPPLSYLAFAVGAVVAARQLARSGFRPDALHANSFLSALVGLLLRRIYRVPLVYTEHWSVFLPEDPATLSGPMRTVARLALERADTVLPVSSAMERALRELAPGARLRVVPNAVDPALFHPAPPCSAPPRPAGGPAGDPARLLYVGLLYDAKGLDVLLPAVAALLRDGRRVTLDIVGDGVLRAETEELAARLGLAERAVTFHGIRPKAEVGERMRGADLLVLSSRFENNPCVLLEALCCGLPVVATRVGGVPEIVDAAAGEIAEPGDVEAFAAALGRALDRLPCFDREQIARTAAGRYGHDAVGAALAEVYAGRAGRS